MLYLPLKLRGVCILVLFSFRPVFWLKVFYSILLNFFRMPSMGVERRLYFIIKTFCIVKLEPFFYTTVYDTSYTNPIKKNYMSSIYTTPMQISVGHFKVWPYNNSTQQIKISYSMVWIAKPDIPDTVVLNKYLKFSSLYSISRPAEILLANQANHSKQQKDQV